jgi:hypothetical protein
MIEYVVNTITLKYGLKFNIIVLGQPYLILEALITGNWSN